MASKNTEFKLRQEILDLIFVEAQNPQLSLVSRGFHSSSKDPYVQAKYLIKKYGKEDVFSYLLQRENFSNQLTQDCGLQLLARGAPLTSSCIHSTVFLKLLEWNKVVKIALANYKIVKSNVQSLDTRANFETWESQYTIEPVLDICEIYTSRFDFEPYLEPKFKWYKRDQQILDFLLYAIGVTVDLTKKHNIPPNLVVGRKSTVLLHRKIQEKEVQKRVIVNLIATGRIETFEENIGKYEHDQNDFEEFLKAACEHKQPEILDHIFCQFSPAINFDFLRSLCYQSGFSWVNCCASLECLKILVSHIPSALALYENLLLCAYYKGDSKSINYLSDIVPETKDNLSKCLYQASLACHTELISSLLDRGADVSFGDYISLRYASLKTSDKDSKLKVLNVLIKTSSNNFKINDAIKFCCDNEYALERLLEIGADVNHENGFLLSNAIEFGNLRILKVLIRHGVNFNISDGQHTSLLISRGKPDIIKLALENGAEFRASKSISFSEACQSQYVPLIRSILESENLPSSEINEGFNNSCFFEDISVAEFLFQYQSYSLSCLSSLLTEAYNKRCYHGVRLLIRKTTDLDYREHPEFEKAVNEIHKNEIRNLLGCMRMLDNVKDVISVACQFVSSDKVRQMISTGTRTYNLCFSFTDYNSSTEYFMEYAKSINYREVVKHFFGSNPTRNSDTSTLFANAGKYKIYGLVEALISSSYRNKDAVNQMLINALKDRDSNLFNVLVGYGDVNAYKGKMIVYACKSGNIEFVKRLLSLGADIKANKCKGFILAYNAGYHDIAQLAIEHGSCQNVVSNWEFITACKEGDLDKVQKIVESGKVNIKYKHSICFAYACSNGHERVARFLLEHGANSRRRQNKALVVSCSKGYFEIAKLLVNIGANVNSNNGRPLKMSLIHGHFKLARHLILLGAKVSDFDFFESHRFRKRVSDIQGYVILDILKPMNLPSPPSARYLLF